MSDAAQGRLLPLDGLRACAIVLVVLHHVIDMPMGWAGVPLFFVLSGFLITGILRRERADPHYWGPFYLKRATRILPPLLVLFALSAVFGSARLDARTAGYAFFGADVTQALPGARSDELTPLWSLAVEEHFYLLWPFAIRYLQRRSVIALSLAMVVLSPPVRALATPLFRDWQPIYFLTPFQLDGLALGSLLAILLEEEVWRTRLRRLAAPAFWMVLATLYALSRMAAFQREANSALFNALGYSLLALGGGTALLEVLLRPDGWAARALSWRPLVFLGSISYGLYLYHNLVLRVVLLERQRGHLHHGRLVAAIVIPTAVVLAAASFRFYEQPLIRWGRARAKRMGDSSVAGADRLGVLGRGAERS